MVFEQDEVTSIKRFGMPGLKLLGFKSLDSIKPYMYIKPGHFLYPDEKVWLIIIQILKFNTFNFRLVWN